MDRSSAESSQTSGKTVRLYPSLPNTDRYEVCVLSCSSAKNLNGNAPHRHKPLPENTQADECSARMKAQIYVLEQQKQELLSINERWAKEYRIMVRYYKEKVCSLKTLLSQRCSHFNKETGEELNPLCKLKALKDNTEAGCGDVSCVVVKTQSEARELEEQNRRLARRGQHQHSEIERLNKALQDALQTSQPQEMSSETLQDLWKHQAEVNKEDFLKERKDRETLKDKYLELEKKYKKVRNELHAIKTQGTWMRTPQAQYKCTCTQPDACPNNGNKLTNPGCTKLQRCYTFKDKL